MINVVWYDQKNAEDCNNQSCIGIAVHPRAGGARYYTKHCLRMFEKRKDVSLVGQQWARMGSACGQKKHPVFNIIIQDSDLFIE